MKYHLGEFIRGIHLVPRQLLNHTNVVPILERVGVACSRISLGWLRPTRFLTKHSLPRAGEVNQPQTQMANVVTRCAHRSDTAMLLGNVSQSRQDGHVLGAEHRSTVFGKYIVAMEAISQLGGRSRRAPISRLKVADLGLGMIQVDLTPITAQSPV